MRVQSNLAAAAAAALVCGWLMMCRPCAAVADKFVWISDFHWDPEYGTPNAEVHLDGAPCRDAGAPKFGAYGCGAPKALVESAIAEAALVSGDDIDFILLTGDMPRHNKDKANLTALPIIQEIREMIYAAFPNVSNVVLPGVILGNNDMSPNYSVNVTSSSPFEPGSTNLSDDNPYFIELASGLAPKAFLGENDTESFEHGAYSVREVIPGLKIMQLNTIVYSPSSSCGAADGEDCPDKTEDPFGQFEWMREELERCREDGCRVYLAAHIPPVMQTYNFGPQLWEESFVGSYLQVVQEYQDVIAAQLMAHVHSNELRAVPGLDGDSAPMIMHTSIAPCYTTNPMVSVVHYDSVTKSPLDLSVYEADLNATNSRLLSNDGPLEWNELCGSLLEFLGLESLSNGAVAEWAASLPEDDARWEAWWNRWYKGPRQEECSGVCRQGESCRLSEGFLAADFDSCNFTQLHSGGGGEAGSVDDDSSSAAGPLLPWKSAAGVFTSSALMLAALMLMVLPHQYS